MLTSRSATRPIYSYGCYQYLPRRYAGVTVGRYRYQVGTVLLGSRWWSDAVTTNAVKQQRSYDAACWITDASNIFTSLDLPTSTTPQQLWPHLGATATEQELQLDLASCRLLMAAAAATCSTQQHYNQLQPLFQAVLPVLPSFELQDFRLLMQLAAHARFMPDKAWLASVYYADTGGFERLYKQELPESLVGLLSDLAAVLGSMQELMQAMQQHTSLLQQLDTNSATTTGNSAASNLAGDPQDLAAEVSALQSALQQGSAHLQAILLDPLLAGELSAIGGYWLLRRFLPAVQHQPDLVLQGLCALPGLGYRVLDAEDADVLLALPATQLQSWTPSQLAAAVTASLPCLGDIVPTDGQQLAVLFAAVGAAASGFRSDEAARVLLVLAQLPGYAPDPQVVQHLLTAALQPPLQHMTARQMYQLLQAAADLGVIPGPSELRRVQEFLGV